MIILHDFMKGQKDQAGKKYILAVDDDHDIVTMVEQALQLMANRLCSSSDKSNLSNGYT
jgi:DNA-binding NtrC family response regulator